MMVDAGPTRRQSTHYFTTRDTFSSVFQCLGCVHDSGLDSAIGIFVYIS